MREHWKATVAAEAFRKNCDARFEEFHLNF
jgi:hypothetical protein